MMQGIFSKILDEYIKSKSLPLSGNETADYIRNTAKELITEDLNLNTQNYKITGSPGQGNWADIPWISVFDKDITSSAMSGYYIVYLFRADMTGVYLSLNQGWTYFEKHYGIKDGRQKISQVTHSWQQILHSTLEDFSFEPIELHSTQKNSRLAKGYELGHICGKFYEEGKLPDNFVLKNDLINLIGVYRELKGKIIQNSVEKTNNYLITSSELGFIESKYDLNSIDDIDDVICRSEHAPPLLYNLPNTITFNDEPADFKPHKKDYIKKVKSDKKLGFAGELAVLEYEKEFLISNGRSDLASKIIHTSEVDGDGAGYDILSFFLDGKKKFIEVKTTSGAIKTPFYFSDNEINFSKLNSASYALYRVFDYDQQSGLCKLFIVQGNILEKFKLKPIQYISESFL